MARENEFVERNRIDITCPRCGSRWTCDDPAESAESTGLSGPSDPTASTTSADSTDRTCPDCETAFSVRIREEFALVERGGWTVAVSLSTPDRGVVGDG